MADSIPESYTFIEVLSYIPWEDVKQLLRTSIHSVKHELSILNNRAMIEQQYAESLGKWASDLRSTLKNDPMFEYGGHKEIIWGLAEEATARAELHKKMYSGITDEDGLTKAPKTFLTNCQVKRRFSLKGGKYTRPCEEEFHMHHKSIFEKVLKDILKCKDIAEKNAKISQKAKELCDTVGSSSRTILQGKAGSAEAAVLSLESESACLTSSHEMKVKHIQNIMPSTLRKAEYFKANLVQQEVERLGMVYTFFEDYLHLLIRCEADRDRYKATLENTLTKIMELSPEKEASEWDKQHTREVECPTEQDCKTEGEVRTSLKTTNQYSYGYKQQVVNLFSVDETKTKT